MSTQLSGFESLGSLISFGGLTGGSKFSRRLPVDWLSPLKRTSYVLLGLFCSEHVTVNQRYVWEEYALYDECIKISKLSDSRLWGNFEMFLLDFVGYWVPVTEDKMDLRREMRLRVEINSKSPCLRTRASKIWAKHDHPWCFIFKLLAAVLEAVLQKFQITTAAVSTLLILDLVLDDEYLFLEINRGGEWGRDRMMGGLGFSNETSIALDGLDLILFDFPFADVTKGFTAHGGLLRCF